MMKNDNAKNTNVWSTNPNAVGHPSRATPGMMLLTKRNVTGLATRKKMSAEMKENLTFRAVERVIVRMWVIFRDPKTVFNHVDKYVVELVEDKDILTYQDVLHKTVGGRTFDIYSDAQFNQKFVTSSNDVEYYARKYACWSSEHCADGYKMETLLPRVVPDVVHVLGTVRHDGAHRK
jgi:hypothetical protein